VRGQTQARIAFLEGPPEQPGSRSALPAAPDDTTGVKDRAARLTGFVATGKLEIQGLASILADITRMAVRQTITAPIARLLQGAFVSGGFPARPRQRPGAQLPRCAELRPLRSSPRRGQRIVTLADQAALAQVALQQRFPRGCTASPISTSPAARFFRPPAAPIPPSRSSRSRSASRRISRSVWRPSRRQAATPAAHVRRHSVRRLVDDLLGSVLAVLPDVPDEGGVAGDVAPWRAVGLDQL